MKKCSSFGSTYTKIGTIQRRLLYRGGKRGQERGKRENRKRGEKGRRKAKKWREIRIWPFLVTICRMVVHGD